MNDNYFSEQLHEAQSIIQDYKTQQKLAGDSWQVYRNMTTNQYDLVFDKTNSNASFFKMYKVTLQIDGARQIPNAFCIWVDMYDEYDSTGQMRGFNRHREDSGDDPLSQYITITPDYNYANTVNPYIGIKFACLSPYKGTIKYEEIPV